MATPGVVATRPVRPIRSVPDGPDDVEYLHGRTDLTANEKRMHLLVNKAARIVSRSSVGGYLFEKENPNRDLLPYATVVAKVVDGLLELGEDQLTFSEKK